MKYFTFLFFFLSFNHFIQAQSTNITISFSALFDNEILSYDEFNEVVFKNEHLEIETFKCYISNVELYDGTKTVYTEKNSFHLLDAADASSLELHLDGSNDVSFSSIQFNIGIDSTTNVAGAFEGDLDPTNGMYWTWQSGYINFKLEGTADICPARNHRFQFHVGGYQGEFNSLQKVKLSIANSDQIHININVDELLTPINLVENYQIMSPSEQAVEMAKLLASIFKMAI
ncbi:MAG: hypothetical protein ACI94Y_002370 [Maribacter sp.]|jgi:hypothetical protein